MTEDSPARNPERRVIDEIDALVDWQLEEGRRRGDGPRPSETAPTSDNVAETAFALRNAISRVCTVVNGVHRLARTIPLIAQSEAAVGARIRGADPNALAWWTRKSCPTNTGWSR